MLVLGLESSCDETGAAVVDDRGRVLSDVVQSQIEAHAPYGGVVPELASRDHLKNVGPVVREALQRAGLTLADVDGIAVTNRPGLVGALLVGVQTAKGLAWGAGKPLVGVDHLVGHLFAVFLDRNSPPTPALSLSPAPAPVPVSPLPAPAPAPVPVSSLPALSPAPAPVPVSPLPAAAPVPVSSLPAPAPAPAPVPVSSLPAPAPAPAPVPVSSLPAPPARPAFPFVALLASGGHTAIYRVDAARPDAITELGGTRDDAAGEAFDKVGKLLGLGYPGGPVIDRLAAIGDARAVPLEAPMLHDKGLDFSFSGIKTKIAYMVEAAPPKGERAVADLCASFQNAVVTVLVDKLLRAATACGVTDVVIGGGVAANRGLRARLTDEARARGMRAFLPPLASCTDNAAMIAYAGALKLATGARDGWDLIATSSTALPRATRKGRGAR